MSINVTVSGNPVSINRGTMVTADPNYAKKEFDRRRKIRLAQVRQQSNNIAENVRKKVRREKEKQLSEIEQRGAEKLEKWKNRKMIELQEQYCESLKDLGLGHAQAIVEETHDEIIDAYNGTLQEKSKRRGQEAARKLHREQREILQKQADERRRRTLAKSVDNFFVETKKTKSPFRKKTVMRSQKSNTCGNVSGMKNDSDSDFDVSSDYDDDVPALDICSAGGSSSVELQDGGKRYRTKSRSPASPVSSSTLESDIREVPIRDTINTRIQQETSNTRLSSTSSRSPSPPQMADIIVHHPPDTRISDRIRSRRLPANLHESKATSYLDEEEQQNRNLVSTITLTEFIPRCCGCCPKHCNICTCNKGSSTDDLKKAKPTQYPSQPCVCCCKCSCSYKNSDKEVSTDLPKTMEKSTSVVKSTSVLQSEEKIDKKKKAGETRAVGETRGGSPVKKQLTKKKLGCQCGWESCKCKKDFIRKDKEIPTKPTVALKSVKSKSSETDVNRVQYYDHHNRFSKEYTPHESQVQKIPDDNIEIFQSSRSETEYMERIYQRDRDAQIRGKKALEKERIQKEYKELLQKLPALQRQERIASINLNNPTFHMGDSRLRQHELKKQCRMEDAYDKLFPNIVTIPPKKHVVDDQPFRTIDITDENRSDPSLIVGRWDFNTAIQDGVTVTRDDGVITINANVSDETDSLRYMLEKLKKQKEALLKEVAGLPRDSNLNGIISDLEKIESPKEQGGEGVKSSSTSTSCESDLPQEPITKKLRGVVHKKRSKSKMKHKRVQHTSSAEVITGSPKKKVHQKIKRIILQNTGTQTSPKTTTSPTRKHRKKSKTTDESISAIPPTTSVATSPLQLKTPSEQSVEPPEPKKVPLQRKKSPDKTIARRCMCAKSFVTDDSEICEILIKIKDDDDPEIKVKSPTNGQKFTIKSLIEDSKKPVEDAKKTVDTKTQTMRNTERSVRIDEVSVNNSRSWREQLSANQMTMGTSSSTSYYSPPDFSRGTAGVLSYSSTPQENRRKLNPRLITYIKKLLSMSRASIDDLGVSTETDISISSSLAHSMQADPMSQLRNVVKFFNLSPYDLAQCMQYSEPSTSSSEPSTSHLSSDASEANVNPLEDTKSQEAFDKQLADAAKKYQNMATKCQERISNLTAAIQKVREEKKQILSPTFSEKESTAYMNLPSHLGEASGRQSPSLSSGSEREQLEIDRRMLSVEIDFSNLRIPSPDSSEKDERRSSVDSEIYSRYRRLVAEELEISQPVKKIVEMERIDEPNNEPFVPMLQDLRRLPKFIVPETTDITKKKPPPAKGITAAKRFNGNITSTAHELSTIVEVDSQLRIPSMSPEKPNKSDVFETLRPEDDIKISEESMPDIVQEISSGSYTKIAEIKPAPKVSDTDSSDKSDMENIEAMLVSMGMGWAVSTLKKTQEALVHAASTSSDGSRNRMTDSSSDITLRDFLGKKLLFQNSTGTSHSGSPFTREFEEISVIHGSGLSVDNRHQRTSTPVQRTSDRSKENSNKVTFSAESELSSVKTSEEAFATIPNYSELPDDDDD